MSELQGGISKKSPTTELDIIRQKRVALQNLVKLTGTLNRLHQGLQSVILMGKSVAQIPEKIVKKFKTLSESLKDKPVDILKNTLTSTDQKIQRDIKHVLEISQKSNELLEKQLGATNNNLADVLKGDYHTYVDDFKKKSQTSITLRIALKTRNVILNSFNLPVPESFIENQIVSLNHKEKECRKKIKEDISSLQDDIEFLISKEDCSPDIKKILNEIQLDLKINADHFNSGKAIDEMPIIYESIELSGQAKKTEKKSVEHNTNKTKNHKNAKEINSIKKKNGFFQHLWKWLNSSWKSSWKDTE